MSQRVSGRLTAAVAVGGALGAVVRYGLTLAWPTPAGAFPLVTFAINISGCLAIGLLLGVERSPLQRAFLGTGVLGGFTTFSSYAVQGDDLWRTGHPWSALAYVIATVICALGAARLGSVLIRRRRSA